MSMGRAMIGKRCRGGKLHVVVEIVVKVECCHLAWYHYDKCFHWSFSSHFNHFMGLFHCEEWWFHALLRLHKITPASMYIWQVAGMLVTPNKFTCFSKWPYLVVDTKCVLRQIQEGVHAKRMPYWKCVRIGDACTLHTLVLVYTNDVLL